MGAEGVVVIGAEQQQRVRLEDGWENLVWDGAPVKAAIMQGILGADMVGTPPAIHQQAAAQGYFLQSAAGGQMGGQGPGQIQGVGGAFMAGMEQQDVGMGNPLGGEG